MSNLSFSLSVFIPFGELSAIFIKFKIVICKLCQFGRVQSLLFGKGLKVTRKGTPRDEQFLLYRQCFHPVWRTICYFNQINPFPKQALVFTGLQYKSFENNVGIGEIARNEQFLLFLQSFQPFLRTFCHFDKT